MSDRRKESSAPDRTVVADVSNGRKLGEAGGFVGRFGVTGARDPEDGSPIVRPEDEVALDPRQLRIHDTGQNTPDGLRDRRLQLQVVNDYSAEYADVRPGDAPYGQDETFTAANRSTRFADGQGRVALPSSLERNVDSEDGRYARALTCVELPLEGPGSVLGKPDAGAGAPAAFPPPPGVALLDAGTSSGTGGTVTRRQPGVSVQGLTINGAAARAAAEAAIAAGGNIQDVRDAALAASQGRSPPPLRQKDTPAATQTKEPEPPPPQQQAIGPASRPGGYLSSEKHGRVKVGLLGTFFTPASGEPMFLGRENTPIGTLPMRRDAQVATDEDRRGAFYIVDDDVADLPEPTGTLIKGYLAHDTSLAGVDTALPGETHKLRPVMRVDAASIPPPAVEPPPYWEPEKPKEEKPEEDAGSTQQPPVPTGPRPLPPTTGPAEGNGQRRPPGPLPVTPRRFVNRIGVGDVPVVTTTGALARRVENPQAQARDFTAPGVPCPNATGGQVLVGERARSGGTTGATPSAPVVSTGHPAVVHTGTGILIGPAQLIGGGVAGGAAQFTGGVPLAGGSGGGNAPVTAADLARGAGAPALQDRFVDRQGNPVPARGLDPVADPRIPVDELNEAIPLSAFPANRRGIVQARRNAARDRENAQKIRDAAKISGVERRRAQNERDLRLNLQGIDRAIQEQIARRAAAQAKKPPDQRAIDRANRDLVRLGQNRSAEQDRAQRQRERLDRSQERLDAARRVQQRREAAKQDQKRRREERARNPRQPRGGVPIDTTDSALAGDAASNSGWIGDYGPEERKAREAAAQRNVDDYTRSQEVNDQLSDESRAAIGLGPKPREPSILDSIPGLEDSLHNATFGGHNVLTTPTPIFGEAGGPADVAGQLQLLATQMRGVLAVLGGAFGGPAYLAGNIAVQHENTPGNPPAPSTIASKWLAGPGEKLLIGRGDNTLEVRSTLGNNGGFVQARTGCILDVIRELYDRPSKIYDDRPAVLIEERTASGQGSGAEAVATMDPTGAGWSATHDGKTRQRLADGTFWEDEHEEDNSRSQRKYVPSSTGPVALGGTNLTETGILSTIDEDGETGPQLDAANGVLRTANLDVGVTEVDAGKPGFAIRDGEPYYFDIDGALQAMGGGGATELDDLSDVDTTGKQDGDVLTYVADDDTWIASPAPASPASVGVRGHPISYGDSKLVVSTSVIQPAWGPWGVSDLNGDYSLGGSAPSLVDDIRLDGRWHRSYKIQGLSYENSPATLDWPAGMSLNDDFTDAKIGAGGLSVNFDLEVASYDGPAQFVAALVVYDPDDGTTEISTGYIAFGDDDDPADTAECTLTLDAADLAGVFSPGDVVRCALRMGEDSSLGATGWNVFVKSISFDLSGA